MAFNYKKALALALSAAMVVTAAPVAGLDVQAAAKKQGTAATKITPTKTSYSVKVGKSTAAITLKLNKKTTKKVTINLKSSNKKVATVSKSKVTIKKGKAGTKSASFKIKGVKKGSAKITASFVNSKGKTVSKKITVKVTKAAATKVAVTGVTLSNTTPKVGDTITANVTPAKASNVTYQWFTGDTASLTTEIAGATSKTYTVTDAELGKFVGVVVKGENDSTATAVSAVAVQKADSTNLQITEAKQSGMNKVTVTFSAAATAADKIAVKKGSADKTISKIDYAEDFKSATLTLADNITSGTYTVSLTPADTNVAASTATLDGVSATKAVRVGFPNNYFVVSNTQFTEGYFFVKGFNQFDEEITLSGLTITVAPADNWSYDSSTGKVTVKSNTASIYAITKTVSAFIQYTGDDGKPLTENGNLEVSSLAYPSDVVFGDLVKDGKMRDDKKLTIAELGSNKYYVPLTTVKDQYGNDMSADDLNKLADTTNARLTVIPTAGTKSMYFGVNNTVFTEVNGKPAIYLVSGNNMPGTANLTLTSAGGTFNKEIEVSDDPYIKTLRTDIPDIYEGEWTDVWTFSGVDQYDNEVNMYDFVPATTGEFTGELAFGDTNHLGGQYTRITSSDTAGTWKVTKDTAKKTFKVSFKPSVAEKVVLTFTAITAGAVSNTQTITVGARGGAAQVSVPAGSGQIDAKDSTYNFNEKVSFKDANGKTMRRMDTADTYPEFLDAFTTPITTEAEKSDTKYSGYYWTVSSEKVDTAKTVATTIFDKDGVISTNNAATAQATNGTLVVGEKYTNHTFHVTLLGKIKSGTGSTVGNYVVLNTKTYRINYVPAGNTTITYSVEDTSGKLLYAKTDSKDNEEIKVSAKNKSGESWMPDQTKITLDVNAPFTTTMVDGVMRLSGKTTSNFDDNTDGTVKVKVYYDGEEVDTVEVKYSNRARVASATETKIIVNDGDRVGKGYDFDTTITEFTTSKTAAAKEGMNDGVLLITNINDFGDTYKASIKDQYDVVMEDTAVRLDGASVSTKTAAITESKTGNFVMSNGTKSVDIKVTAGKQVDTNKSTATSVATTNYNANSVSQLNTYMALATAAKPVTVNVTNDITFGTAGAEAFTIPANVTVVVPAGKTVDVANATNKTDLDVQAGGTLKVEGALLTGGAQNGTVAVNGDVDLSGTWTHTGTGVFSGSGEVTGTGHFNLNGAATNTYAGIINLSGDTFVIGANVKFDAAVKIKGHTKIAAGKTLEITGVGSTLGGEIDIEGKLDTDAGNTTLENGAYIKTTGTADLSTATGLNIASGDSITVESASGSVRTETAKSAVVASLTGTGATATTGELNAAEVTSAPVFGAFGFIAGDKIHTVVNETWGLQKTAGDYSGVFYLLTNGPKQSGLTKKVYLRVTATGLAEADKDMEGKNLSGANGNGTDSDDAHKYEEIDFATNNTSNGWVDEWTNTFNGTLSAPLPEGAVITATLYDTDKTTVIGTQTYTVTAADVAQY